MEIGDLACRHSSSVWRRHRPRLRGRAASRKRHWAAVDRVARGRDGTGRPL